MFPTGGQLVFYRQAKHFEQNFFVSKNVLLYGQTKQARLPSQWVNLPGAQDLAPNESPALPTQF